VALISMVVVGLSAAQLVWALLPALRPTGWQSVVLLGVVGSLAGGFLTIQFLHQASRGTGAVHPMGLFGSILGTVALVSLSQLPRGGRL
jgi:uncharacterized membrane protein YeaQ/YmgE (transglycosylase-associated protein family)